MGKIPGTHEFNFFSLGAVPFNACRNAVIDKNRRQYIKYVKLQSIGKAAHKPLIIAGNFQAGIKQANFMKCLFILKCRRVRKTAVIK